MTTGGVSFLGVLGLGLGERGALKGCAADVDVAAGGLWEDEGEPCRGAVVAVSARVIVAACVEVEEMSLCRVRTVVGQVRGAANSVEVMR